MEEEQNQVLAWRVKKIVEKQPQILRLVPARRDSLRMTSDF